MKQFFPTRRPVSFLITMCLGLFGLALYACSGASANDNPGESSSTAAHGNWSAKISGQLLSASNATSPSPVSLQCHRLKRCL